jgi:hypothetical protein
MTIYLAVTVVMPVGAGSRLGMNAGEDRATGLERDLVSNPGVAGARLR